MFLDTSGLFCYHHRDEIQHQKAQFLFRTASRLVTHDYVLAEFIPLCRARGLNMPEAYDFVESLLNNPGIEVYWVNEATYRAALTLLEARPDKTYSLCDAVSFVVMRLLGITEALPTDRHFEQEGFTRLLEP